MDIKPIKPPKVKDVCRKYDSDGYMYWGVINVVTHTNVVVLWQTGEYETIKIKDFHGDILH